MPTRRGASEQHLSPRFRLADATAGGGEGTSSAARAHLACTGISRAGHQLCVRHVFLSGALGKRMGLSIASAKNEQGQHSYRLEK